MQKLSPSVALICAKIPQRRISGVPPGSNPVQHIIQNVPTYPEKVRPDQTLAAPVVRICVLGPLEVWVGERPVPVAGRKDRALIGVLALSSGTSVFRARLAGLLWGESAEMRARDSLKQALRRLRRLFADQNAEVLATDRNQVALAPGIRVDADALFCDQIQIAGKDLLTLRRGVLLDGIEVAEPAFQNWLLLERMRTGTAFLDLTLAQMRHAEKAGRAGRIVEFALCALAADPTNEEAERAVMRVHLGRGERRLALQRFDVLRARLAAELDIEPEDETVDLVRHIRARTVAEAAPIPSASEVIGLTVAVLPFVTIGGGPSQDFFADGLTEDIITDLARFSRVNVTARSAAFALKGRCVGPIDAARLLGATHVLEGSVRREGGRVRVTVRLLEGATGRQIWAGRFDDALGDVFALQDRLARQVLDVLTPALGGAILPSRRGTRNLEAYELFLKARSLYLRGLDHHGLSAARMLLTRAVERDDQYAQAYSLLAICEFYLAVRDGGMGRSDYAAHCLGLARRARFLDPDLADAHAATGLACYAGGRYVEADRAFATATRLDPDLFEAHFFQARNRRLQGDRAVAARLFAQAAALRPEDYRTLGLLAEELSVLGRRDEADEALARTERALEAALERHPENSDAMAFGASVFAEFGRADQAREWIRWALAMGEGEGLVQFNYNLTRAFAALGQPLEAAEMFQRILKTDAVVRKRIALWMKYDPVMAPLLDVPNFSVPMDPLA